MKFNLAGSHQHRASRFRDKRDNAPDNWRNAWFSLGTSILRRTPFQPTLPWLPIAAIRQINFYLQTHPDATCLEYGSGMSTLWLARRCRHLWSVENSPAWYDRIQQLSIISGIDNLTYKLYPDHDDYLSFPNSNDRFDFILVDGRWRSEAVRQALYHLKPHGWLYLDDTDRSTHDTGTARTEKTLCRYAQELGGQLIYITDFVAHEFKVRQGVLLMSNSTTAMRKKASMVKPLQDVSSIARIYFEIQHLKHLYRQGWLKAGITADQCESVAEHSFGVAILAMLIAGEHYPDLDQLKVLKMGLLHDLAEARVGDFMPGILSEQEKHRREQEALAEMLSHLMEYEEYQALWNEYEAGISPEAQFVKQIDRLEMALQTVAYQKKFASLDLQEFFDSSRKRIKDKVLLEIVDEAENLNKGGNL